MSISLEIVDFNLNNSDILIKELIEIKREPFIVKNYNIGSCVNKWNPDYLKKSTNPDKIIKIHKSKEPQLNFIKKNFCYDSVTFAELIDNCSKSEDYSSSDKEYWYLRSLGEDPRGKDVADLSIHFPELFKDVNLPDFIPSDKLFSSVFRITSPFLQLWTHYDTCDNVLIQIVGRKRIVLFRPNEALNLYLEGDKSEIIEIDNPDLVKYPKFAQVKKFEGELSPGDLIFIPALWFHNITALDFSVSINAFWKNLPLEFYDKKDTYGNKELIPAQLAFRTFDKAIAQIKSLPNKEYSDFYLRRMIITLQKQIDNLNLNK